MQEAFEIDAVVRSEEGKGASRRLRRTGMVPGIVYGGRDDPQMIATRQNELNHHLDNEAFFSHVLTLKVDGKPQKVVLKDLQRHPSKPFILHFDMQRIRMDEEIRMTIPFHFEGEEASVGVKMGGGTLLYGMKDVEIECLPGNLPEYIAIDVSGLDVDDVIHLSEIVFPEGVSLVGADQLGEEHDPIVATVEVIRAEEELEAEEGEELEAAPQPSEPEESDKDEAAED